MKFLSALAAFLFCVSSAEAHEAIFAWTYTTDLTPKGHGEFEQWITPRWGKEHGSYSVIDFREEFEHGVTDNFQVALYLNHHYVYSGAAWAYWNDLVSSPGDFEMSAKAWAMKIHGAAAMAILVLVGMLLTGHMRFAWRARRNRGNGSLFLGGFGILIVTGYGLYYAGGESLRA